MSKEYLDKGEVGEIFDVVIDNVEIEEGIYRKELLLWGDDIDNLIDQICQLKPKNQVVVAEGKIRKIYYSVNFIKIDFAGLPEKIALGKSLPKNKLVKIILKEE